MIYFITQQWSNTKGNHAGMVYLHECIRDLHPNEVRTLILPDKKKKLAFLMMWLKVLITLLLIIKVEDVIFFTECLSFKKADQTLIARIIHKFRPSLKLWGMVHCIPSILENLYPQKNYKYKLAPFTGIVTLGSSLSKYLVDNGVDKDKVHILFHYVDTEYYKPFPVIALDSQTNYKLHCICMGNLGRDYTTLAKIVLALPNIHFDICKGKKNIEHFFKGCRNVTLHGFLSENDLKTLMNHNDVSLNIMLDTIGSNVICTSMAMGLAMVCSDVGSIRDYCDDSNSILCKNVDEFISALDALANDGERVKMMKNSSLQKSSKYNISKYYSVLRMNLL